MRWTGWVFAAMVLGMTDLAAGHQPDCIGCNGGSAASSWMQKGFGGAACVSPPGYALVPGCCEAHRRCCDNAWAGYCDHRAKVEAFWSRVGTPQMYVRPRPCRQTPITSCSDCDSCSPSIAQPTPAVPATAPVPAPTPAPDKSGRSAYILRQW